MRQLTYKYRIYPTPDQERQIRRICGCARFLYNKLLEDRTKAYRETGKWQKIDAAPYMKLPFMKTVDQMAMRHAESSLKSAYRYFFYIERTKHDRYRKDSILKSHTDPEYKLMETDLVGYPQFKKKKSSKLSYSTYFEDFKVEGNRFELPSVGTVKIKFHRPLPEDGTITRIIIQKRASGNHYLLLHIQLPDVQEMVEFRTALGIIYTPGKLVTRSDGIPVQYRLQEEELTRKIQKAYKTLKRRRPGSARYEKQRKYLASLYEHRYNQRRDDMHKAARQITNAADLVYMQQPDVTYRLSKLRGKTKRAQQLDEAWWTFHSILETKAMAEGKRLWAVPRQFPIFGYCSRCDLSVPGTNEPNFCCPACHLKMDKYMNAASNLENLGRKYIQDQKEEQERLAKEKASK